MNSLNDKASNFFIVISAPSGTGKTTMYRNLLASERDLKFSVSCTTRPARPGEVDGKDYYFMSDQSFREMIERGEFVEWVEHFGNLYGTTRKTIESCRTRGCNLVIDVEHRGARKIKETYSDGVFIFVLPPSIEELKKRLVKRGFDSEAAIRERLNNAYEEIKEAVWYDYVIFNDRLDGAVEQLRAIYLAEKSRRERQWQRIIDFLSEAGEKTISNLEVSQKWQE